MLMEMLNVWRREIWCQHTLSFAESTSYRVTLSSLQLQSAEGGVYISQAANFVPQPFCLSLLLRSFFLCVLQIDLKASIAT